MNPLSAALSQRARSVEEANTATPEDAHESVLQLGACANGAETSVVRQPESLDKETADGDAEQTNLQVAGYVTPPSNPQGRCPLATIANTNSTEADCSCSSISGLETVSKPHEDLYTWKAQTPMPHPQQEGRRLESWNSAEKVALMFGKKAALHYMELKSIRKGPHPQEE